MTIRHRRFRFAAALVLLTAVPLLAGCPQNTHTNPPPPTGDQDAGATTAPTTSAAPVADGG